MCITSSCWLNISRRFTWSLDWFNSSFNFSLSWDINSNFLSVSFSWTSLAAQNVVTLTLASAFGRPEPTSCRALLALLAFGGIDNCRLIGKFGGGRGVSILGGFRLSSLDGGVVNVEAKIGRGVRRTNWKVESYRNALENICLTGISSSQCLTRIYSSFYLIITDSI